MKSKIRERERWMTVSKVVNPKPRL
jgi:hypothetical protein